MAITRRQLRRDILRSLGDLRVLTATADSASNVTFIDAINLNGEVGAYNGREVYFTGGTAANIGELRYVSGSSSTARNLVFNASLPANPVIGDECEMLNTRGIGFRLQDANEAINQCIRTIAGENYLESASSAYANYARGTAIPIPAEFTTVEDVQWQDPYDDTRWRVIPKASRPNGHGWWVDRSTRTVQITGRLPNLNGWCAGGRTLRIWGLSVPSPLYDDNDETSINAAWVVAQSCAILLRGRYYRMPTPETERLMYDAIQEARGLQPRATSRRGPFSESVE